MTAGGYQDLQPLLHPAYVYRAWSADGRCLYVGSTGNLWGRISNHHSAPWWPLVDRVDVQGFPTIFDAEWEEYEQARRLQPEHCTRYGKFLPDTPYDHAWLLGRSPAAYKSAQARIARAESRAAAGALREKRRVVTDPLVFGPQDDQDEDDVRAVRATYASQHAQIRDQLYDRGPDEAGLPTQ